MTTLIHRNAILLMLQKIRQYIVYYYVVGKKVRTYFAFIYQKKSGLLFWHRITVFLTTTKIVCVNLLLYWKRIECMESLHGDSFTWIIFFSLVSTFRALLPQIYCSLLQNWHFVTHTDWEIARKFRKTCSNLINFNIMSAIYIVISFNARLTNANWCRQTHIYSKRSLREAETVRNENALPIDWQENKRVGIMINWVQQYTARWCSPRLVKTHRFDENKKKRTGI